MMNNAIAADGNERIGHRMSRTRQDRSRRPAGRKPGLIGRAVRGVFRLIWAFTWRLTAVAVLMVAGATGYYYLGLPAADDMFDGRAMGSVTLQDRDGNTFAWRGEQYGGHLRAEEVSPHLVHAVIAAEDRRYYSHIGIDPRGIARAMYANWKAGGLVQGGSTLTQQVAKNVFLDARKTIERKIKEIPMALALEMKYTKEQILTIYLNRVYLGAGTYGFEAASQRYFGKSARVLSPAEAAMLAGLLKAPSRWAPTRDLATSQGRASVVIRLMEEQGYLTQSQTIQALANPAQLSTAAAARAGGAFADWIMERGGEDQFLDLLKAEDVEITTTFDPRVQKTAEDALADVFERKVRKGSEAQAAIVVMTYDGAVRAMVGGRERGAYQFNRATQALRQTGSAFKPVVYAAGLLAGLNPLDEMDDAPIRIGDWSPSNYTDRYLGPVTLQEALEKSINTVAVRVSEHAGRDQVRRLAYQLGLTTPIAPGPAVALGTSEARLIEMVALYATIANGGRRVDPYGMYEMRLRGDDVPIDRGPDAPGPLVLDPKVAGLLTHMMQGVVENGTGTRAKLEGWQVAGKTGTTQKARDAWFIGFTSEYVVGVWMGYDDNRPLTGVTGGGLPAEIWHEVMARLHQGLEPKPLNAVAPEPRIVLAPEPGADGGPGPQPEFRAPDRTGTDDTVVDQVLKDVVRSLGGETEGDGRNRFEGEAGNDR